MARTRGKSVLAVVVGFLTAAILSSAADVLLEGIGLMKMEAFKESPTWVILLVTAYRFVFNIVGCFIAARMAPNRPMFHAMIIGWIGLALSIVGTAVMRDKAVPWYNFSIILMAIPCAWLGGRLGAKNVAAP